MIKNIVFDFGQVIVHFEPSYMAGKYVSDPADAKLLEETVFDRLYWDRLDAGTISDEETVSAVKARLPERLHAAAEKIYYNWIYNIPEIDGMRELINKIKAQYGARVYLLSNISTYFASHSDEIPALRLFDKCIFSAVCRKVKPSREIFKYLCSECDILPEETLFVDDNAANIAGARSVGINGYLFDGNAARLEAYIDGIMSK
ncbi:MAG: HAD family phosphatase [Clostridia bacterium]|nr:HAD family phosphatase [Clostridia bacterium]